MGDTAAGQVLAGFAAPEVPDALREAAERSAARRAVVLGRRRLTPPVRAMLWALRLYVLVMLAVVAVQIARLGG